jgi:hypothetical protein
MSKRHLNKYVESKNWIRQMFGDPLLDANNLSSKDVAGLLDSIEGDLSPENLACDGELRGAKLKAKATMLMGARAELQKMVNQPA